MDEEAAEVRREQGIVWTPSGEKVVVKVTDRRVRSVIKKGGWLRVSARRGS